MRTALSRWLAEPAWNPESAQEYLEGKQKEFRFYKPNIYVLNSHALRIQHWAQRAISRRVAAKVSKRSDVSSRPVLAPRKNSMLGITTVITEVFVSTAKSSMNRTCRGRKTVGSTRRGKENVNMQEQTIVDECWRNMMKGSRGTAIRRKDRLNVSQEIKETDRRRAKTPAHAGGRKTSLAGRTVELVTTKDSRAASKNSLTRYTNLHAEAPGNPFLPRARQSESLLQTILDTPLSEEESPPKKAVRSSCSVTDLAAGGAEKKMRRTRDARVKKKAANI